MEDHQRQLRAHRGEVAEVTTDQGIMVGLKFKRDEKGKAAKKIA